MTEPSTFPLLSLLVWLPIIGGFGCLLLGNARANAARWLGLAFALATLALSVGMFTGLDHANAGMQFVENHAWVQAYDLRYHLGADGISIALVALTALTTVLALVGAWGVDKRVSQYYAAFLLLEGLMVGVFCAMDAMLFYVFFEAMLIPMFVIIGVWGGPRRVYASLKFFLYTFLGSVFMLVALIWLYLKGGSWQLADMAALPLTMPEQAWVFFAFLVAFAVKVPMFPVHTWLPDAHVEAPTGGSVILAGVLLKMGGYGFLRFSLPMFPDASLLFQPLMFWLSVIAIVYASLIAWRQTDIKKLVAYSSVAHMGFVTLGIFSFTEQGIQGAIYQMLSHGVISGALFFCVGVIYDRTHTREISFYGGLVHRMPVYAALFMLFSMANVGLPGTSGFVGEILTMVGGFQASIWAAAGAALGVILSAVYMLTLYRRTVFGEMTNEKLFDIKDVTMTEFFILGLLAISALVLGVAPALIFDLTKASTVDILHMIGRAAQ